MGLAFGEATGTLAGGITVKSNTAIRDAHAFVISMLEANDVHHRIVIPSGTVTDIGDIQYVDSKVIGFELTITAAADANGNTAYDYMKTVTSGSGSS